MKKKLSIVLAISIILGIFSGLEITANALDSSGSCGTSVYYTFNSSTGLLTISGSGAMTNFPYDNEGGRGSSSFFSGQKSIKKIIVNYGVTSIGEGAFSNCTGLTSATIPGSVTSIHDYSFSGCNKLTSITIPDSVKSIGERAFGGCSSLTSISIPDSVKSIESFAFFDCSGLTDITIPDSVTSISESTFDGCSGLTSITIPSSITSIGYAAFYGCTKLTSITIPDSVISIDYCAFKDCSGLKNVVIGNGVTSIGNYAFDNCSGLTSITIGNSVSKIGSLAFEDCSNLTSVNISSIKAWCEIAFSDWYSNPLYYAHRLLLNGEEITDLVIPNSVTSIGHLAFYGCSCLTSIAIPNTVTSIGNEAFQYCTGLTDIIIPDSVTSIGDHAFANCTGLTSASIGNGVTIIRYSIFDDCEYLKNVVIGNGVISIGNYAFGDCIELTDVYYSGTEDDWNNISIGSGNSALTNATIHYNYLPAHEHSYTSAVTTAPTCGKSGVKTYTCSVCGDTYTEIITATGEHTYTSSVTTASTCTKAGVRMYTCSVCGEKNTEEIAALGHNMKLIEAVEPSGTQTGHNAYYHCTRCDRYFKDVNGTTETTPEAEIIEIQITLTKIEIHSLPDKTDYFVGESFTSDGLKIKATYSDGTSSVLDTGFTCSVVDTSSAGQKTVIVTYEGKTATFNINIKKAMTENDGAMVVSRVTARPGNNVDVTVELTKNPGIISMKLKVNYDESVMTLKTVTDAGILGSATHSNKYSSPYTLTWANDTATENITATGVIVTLSFEVKQGALEGEYPVSVTYNTTTDDDIINFDLDSVDFDITNGAVTVKNYIVGDVNGDGSVTTKDRIVLSRYLADWEGYGEDVIDVNAADVNGDGSVTTKDRIILSRHLADWAGYETLPYAG